MKKYLVGILVIVGLAIILSDLFSQIKLFILDKRLKYWKWQGLRRKKAGIIVSA